MISLNRNILRNPKPLTEFRRYNNHLALFHRTSDHLDYWRDYWSPAARASLLQRGINGDLGEFAHVVNKYVPRDLPVLEAGCGPGHLVAALQARGYEAIGVDYEPEVIASTKDTKPNLDVRVGNILSLDFPDGSFGCYMSVGVVEHFEEGSHAALVEARRLLDKSGVALISVPYLNPRRARSLKSLHTSTAYNAKLEFHQYYFSIKDFQERLHNSGLEVVETYPYAVEAFLIREHPIFSGFWHSTLCRERLKRPLRKYFTKAPRWLRYKYAHMLMFVCQPVYA